MIAHPFVKYVGGKRQLLASILARVPASFGTYHEPFVGGGALYWPLCGLGRSADAFLSDGNARLIRTYRAIQEDVEAVIRRLVDPRCTYDPGVFATVRACFNASRIDPAYTDADVAAYFIYLNKCGFNGLFRENQAGDFNVAFGKFATPPVICDAENLRACAAALRHAKVTHQDFRAAEAAMNPGDFAYFDPPYAPMSATSDFTHYGKDPFGCAEQIALHDLALTLANRGVHVLLSNSSAPVIRELYADFEQVEVQARRAVNRDGTKRGAVTELLLIPKLHEPEPSTHGSP